MSATLFTPFTSGAFTFPNRVVMAPLTRLRATPPGDVPNELMKTYYVQRASAGLIISEGSQISPQGKGYMNTPGIYSAEQVQGWQKITAAVHAAGGHMALQLWHVGRVSHHSLQIDQQLPVSASAIPFQNRTTICGKDGQPTRVDCDTPRALELSEIPGVIADYHHAAANARKAGFDMVEVHAAHGYLLHQFQATESNKRTDAYGGSLENRARLTLEALDAVIGAWDARHVGIRISPLGTFNGLNDSDGLDMALYLAREFTKRGIAYLHLSEPDWAGGPAHTEEFRRSLRAAFPATIIGAGNYTVAKADGLLAKGLIDAAAFGRAFIANPDLPARLQQGAELNAVDEATVYGGGAKGYTDYPTLT